MKIPLAATITSSRALYVACALALACSSMQASAQTASSNSWEWRLTLYGWFPSVHASTQQFSFSDGSDLSTELNADGYLSHLKFAFMGSLEARKGLWSFVGDGIYLNFGSLNTKVKEINGPGGNVTLPLQANASTELRGFAGTLAAGYSVSPSPQSPADLIAGARYLRVKPKLEWEFSGPAGTVPQRGSVGQTKDAWDAIVGVRGRAALAGNWFVPYYGDVGAGSSRFTWQALAGIGYRYAWGDVTLVYRHLAYDFKSDEPLSDLSFSGPAVGLSFRF